MKNKNLDIIQVYRGIAALMVAVFHFWIHMSHFFEDEFHFIRKLTKIGSYGVDFFFVLSGFIISYSYINKKISIKKYLANRYLRIYLPYIPLGIIFALGYTYLPNISLEDVEFSWLATLTLLPVGNTSLVVAWSLVHEIIFYFVFIIAIINYKKYNIFLIIWSIFIIIFNITDFKTNIYILDFIFYKVLHLYNFEFMMGYLCFLFIEKIKNKTISIFLAFISILLFLILYFNYYNLLILKFLYSMFSFWLIIIAYQYNEYSITKNNFFMKMGNYSYSLYLLHIPVQIVFFRVFPHTNIWLTFFLGMLLTLICSYIYSQIFEKKLLYFIKEKLKI